MGGLIVLIAFTCTFVFASVFILNLNFNELLFCVFPLFCYGGIGLIDDILIIAKHNNKGVKPLTKVLMQLISVSMYYFIFNKNFNTNQTNWINNQFYIDINNGTLPGVFNIGK